MTYWRDGWKSTFRDLCSVICIFLPLLFTLPRGLCFSGFCQLLRLVSKAERQQFRSTSVRCHRSGGWVLWAEWTLKRQLLVPLPVRYRALTISGEKNIFWWTKTLCDGSKGPVCLFQVRFCCCVVCGGRVHVCVTISRRGRFKDGSRCADREMFIQLGSTVMYPAGEEKCSKPIFFSP